MILERLQRPMCYRSLLLFLRVTVCPVHTLSPARSKQEMDRFVSPDGELVALVIHVGKEAGFENYESRVELRTKEGSLLCPADYSSEDSEHGYGVAKAA